MIQLIPMLIPMLMLMIMLMLQPYYTMLLFCSCYRYCNRHCYCYCYCYYCSCNCYFLYHTTWYCDMIEPLLCHYCIVPLPYCTVPYHTLLYYTVLNYTGSCGREAAQLCADILRCLQCNVPMYSYDSRFRYICVSIHSHVYAHMYICIYIYT